MSTPDIFLDTSALFAGIWSPTGGARMLLKLGEAGVVQLVVSSQVLTEIENVLRRKSPELLGALTVILNQSQIVVSSILVGEHLAACQAHISYAADALIVATAWSASADYFVTLDQQHILGNLPLYQAVPS
ncbi:MAG: PIN domain-containing protein [Anaerolineae bacterium]|nr:PIN domain-containing protein [Anaerolineae bacterium]